MRQERQTASRDQWPRRPYNRAGAGASCHRVLRWLSRAGGFGAIAAAAPSQQRRENWALVQGHYVVYAPGSCSGCVLRASAGCGGRFVQHRMTAAGAALSLSVESGCQFRRISESTERAKAWDKDQRSSRVASTGYRAPAAGGRLLQHVPAAPTGQREHYYT